MSNFNAKRFADNPPCYICGYNGPNYFQPTVHRCAEMYHEQRITALEAQLAEAQDLIDNFVCQECRMPPAPPETDPTYNSMSLSTYAEAIAYLVKAGRMEYVGEPRGRCAIARRVKA